MYGVRGERNMELKKRQKIVVRLLALFLLVTLIALFLLLTKPSFHLLVFYALFILLYLMARWCSSDSPEEKDHYWKSIQLFITIVFICFLSNELVAPLVSPRIIDIKTTPMYIWGMEPSSSDEEINYYTLYDIVYEIELPYVLLNKKIDLRMPGEESSTIDLVTSFQENNPYYNITISEKDMNGSFLSSRKLNGMIPILINTHSREIKKIQAHFIVREKIDFHPSRIVRSNPRCRTKTTISPIHSTGNEVPNSERSLIGYGQDQYGGRYRFYDLVTKSMTDLEINGFRIPVEENSIFCSEGFELTKEYDKYISIDLQPKEMKHILVLNDVSEEMSILDGEVVFNFTQASLCYGAWLKYKELTGL